MIDPKWTKEGPGSGSPYFKQPKEKVQGPNSLARRRARVVGRDLHRL